MNEVLPRLIKSPYKITKLKVVRDDTGASVVVRVNDRGPYVDGRILDLSVAAGKDIGLDKVGHAKVTATVIVLPRLIKSPYKIR